MVVLPASHELATLEEVPIAALDGLTLLGAQALPELASVVAACEAAGSHPLTTAWSVTHPLTLAALAAAGEGLALVSPTLAGVPFRGGVLRPLADGPTWELLALRPNEQPAMATVALLDELRRVLAARPLLRAASPAPVSLAA
jgi:DNA-binding transcriptional LysR family regulator